MDKQKRLEIGRPEVLQVGTETRPIVYLEKMENPDYFVFITTPTETYVERSLNNSHFSVAKIFLQTLWKIPDDKVDYFLHKSKLNFKNLFLQSSPHLIDELNPLSLLIREIATLNFQLYNPFYLFWVYNNLCAKLYRRLQK